MTLGTALLHIYYNYAVIIIVAVVAVLVLYPSNAHLL
jgi:hypothetical protein